MFRSSELVKRPEVNTAMQLDREGPLGQNDKPTAANPTWRGAGPGGDLHRLIDKNEGRLEILVCYYNFTFVLIKQRCLCRACQEHKDVYAEHVRSGSKWSWYNSPEIITSHIPEALTISKC